MQIKLALNISHVEYIDNRRMRGILSFVKYLHLLPLLLPRYTSCALVPFATWFFTSKGNSNVYLILLLLFHSCFNIQVPGRPVACVLQSDKREEPLSRHEVVSAMLRDVQGLLCTKNATKELTSVRLAGSQLFAILLFINTHTPTHAFSDQILSDDI